MKIDDERPYHSTVFHKLKSYGGPRVDEPERETKHNLLVEKMVEQTNPSEHSFMKAEHQNGGKTRQIRIEDVSYDKDVVEIKLPDTVVSSDYGGHFVKDVCIDEGVLVDQKASAEKVVGEKVSPNFDSSLGDTNGDPMEEIRADSVNSAQELKSQIVILPVACATDGNTAEQYSSCKVHDLEGNNTTADLNNLNDENLIPKQLLSHEGAKDCQQVCTVIFETCENHEPFLDGEAIDQVSPNGCHEIGVSIASETSNLNGLPAESSADGLSGVMPEEDVVSAALDKRGSNQVNHYNPFIAYGSLEDTWEPKYSLPTTVDAASILPICPVEKTDSFSDIVNCTLGGFDYVETAESIIQDSRLDSVDVRSNRLDPHASEESNDKRGSPVEKTDVFGDLVNGAPGGSDSIETDGTRIEDSTLDSTEAISSRLDVQASEESNDQRENLVNEMRTDAAHGASLSTSIAEPSVVKCKIDSVQDVHDFNPRDVEDGTKRSEDNTDSKSPTFAQTESVVQQNGPDSAKLMARTGIRNPFESSFSGPSISSGPLTPSGDVPYSGNISLRSDSSTTSTRSFAFPVLQTEWNSSPVKMVKADHRRLRQDRGWGYRILCCKF